MSKRGDLYREIPVTIWDREDFRSISVNGQALVLYIYMLSSPSSNRLPGLFRAGEASLAEGLRWPLDMFQAAFADLELHGMAVAEWTAPLVWMPWELNDFNLPKNINHAKGWVNTFRLLPECALKDLATSAVLRFLNDAGYTVSIPSRMGLDTHSNPVAVAVAGAGTETGAGVTPGADAPTSPPTSLPVGEESTTQEQADRIVRRPLTYHQTAATRPLDGRSATQVLQPGALSLEVEPGDTTCAAPAARVDRLATGQTMEEIRLMPRVAPLIEVLEALEAHRRATHGRPAYFSTDTIAILADAVDTHGSNETARRAIGWLDDDNPAAELEDVLTLEAVEPKVTASVPAPPPPVRDSGQSPNQVVFAHYVEAFEKKYGIKAPTITGREGALLKSVLTTYTIEQITAALDRYFDDGSEFYRGHALAKFLSSSQYPRFLVEPKSKSNGLSVNTGMKELVAEMERRGNTTGIVKLRDYVDFKRSA